MSMVPKKVMRTGKATLFAIGLALVLAAMLAIAATAPSSQAETTSAQTTGPATDQSPDANGQRLVEETFDRTELYFGSEKPGPDVTREQFDRFVDKTVTPRFPDGLTLLTGYGQFRESDGKIVQERSFVLILLYPTDDEEANGEIQEIRRIYKRDFEQQSVLRVDSREQVSF